MSRTLAQAAAATAVAPRQGPRRHHERETPGARRDRRSRGTVRTCGDRDAFEFPGTRRHRRCACAVFPLRVEGTRFWNTRAESYAGSAGHRRVGTERPEGERSSFIPGRSAVGLLRGRALSNMFDSFTRRRPLSLPVSPLPPGSSPRPPLSSRPLPGWRRWAAAWIRLSASRRRRVAIGRIGIGLIPDHW
jgi:hypothetical protein